MYQKLPAMAISIELFDERTFGDILRICEMATGVIITLISQEEIQLTSKQVRNKGVAYSDFIVESPFSTYSKISLSCEKREYSLPSLEDYLLYEPDQYVKVDFCPNAIDSKREFAGKARGFFREAVQIYFAFRFPNMK